MRWSLAVVMVGLSAGVARAEPAAGVVLDGAVTHSGAVDAGVMGRLAGVSLPVAQGTGHGVSAQRASGVLLWDLLRQAGPVDAPGAKHAGLRHTVLVSGRDGYQVAFSFGELDPGGSGDPVVLVREAGGGGVGLVVPGDHTAARDVHDVVRITVR